MSNFFKKAWEKMNGKKTFTGAGLILAGLGAAHVPFLQPISGILLSAGFGTFGIGVAHKVQKAKANKVS